jgi:pimeloyl-ACP methyl ester carboxylesterase
MTTDTIQETQGSESLGFRRLLRGSWCWVTFLVAPLGWFFRGRFIRRLEPERLDRGLVLILPGIEGRSFLNISLMQGLVDGGVPYGMEIVDWTTGNKFLALYHLRAWRRNRKIAAQLAERITRYQQNYPGRPVWLIGYSGGAAMSMLTLAALPEESKITGIVLLAAALSPGFDLSPAFAKLERGIWSFHSWNDWLFVGLGTTLFGTMDGWHMPGAGLLGFRMPREPRPLTQTAYHPRMLRQFNFGGHFGCVHRVWVEDHIAPILRDAS